MLNVIYQDKHVNFVKIAGRYTHHAAIDKFGRLFTWGDNTNSALGHLSLVTNVKNIGDVNGFSFI